MQQIVVCGKGVETTWEDPRIHPLVRRHLLCALRVRLGIGRTVQGNEHRKIHEVGSFSRLFDPHVPASGVHGQAT
jgi:hypothetical protein